MSQYRRIAWICRAKGPTGEVVVASDYDLPLHFWDDLQLFIVPPAHELPRTTKVTEAKQLSTSSFTLKFYNVNDKDTAQKLVGRHLLVHAQDRPNVLNVETASVLGLKIIDKNLGLVGSITEVRVGKVQDLWVVEGSFGEVLIPAAADLIISRSEQSVNMDLPLGLLELNQ